MQNFLLFLYKKYAGMSSKDTFFSPKLTITSQGRLIDFSVPRVMGILNITPDSFYDGGRYLNETAIVLKVSSMLEEGADLVDVGAYSSRPGASGISPEEEKSRLKMALGFIRQEFPEVLISIDTFRADIAEYAIGEFGAGMINDISAGRYDDQMLTVAGKSKVPVILMHMQGDPQTMQNKPEYKDIVKELLVFFAERIAAAKLAGVKDVIIDPGFGFGKTVHHNFQLLRELSLFSLLEMPVMVGLSRKSMVYKPINASPEEALNGTTVLNTLALSNGAQILRVHDVKEAVQAVKLFCLYHSGRD
jgi:dihydropteroate synthase